MRTNLAMAWVSTAALCVAGCSSDDLRSPLPSPGSESGSAPNGGDSTQDRPRTRPIATGDQADQAAAAAAQGNGATAPPRPPRADVVAEEDANEPLAASDCAVGEPIELGTTTARRPAVTASFAADRGGVAAWARDDATAAVVALEAGAAVAGTATELPMAAAMDLRWLMRTRGGYVLGSHAVCTDQRHFEKCLYLQVVAVTPGSEPAIAPRGELFRHTTGEWASGPMVALGDQLVWLRGHTYQAPALDRFEITAAGAISHRSLDRLDHGLVPHETEPATAMALATSADRVAALVSVPGERSQRLMLHLVTTGGETPLAAAPVRVPLELPAQVDGRPPVGDLAFAGEGLQLIVLTRQSRARIATLGTDGRLIAAPAPMGPAPYGPVVAEATAEGRRTLVQRRDAAGRRVGAAVALPASRSAAVAGEDGRFVVVTAEGQSPSTLRLRRLDCSAAQ